MSYLHGIGIKERKTDLPKPIESSGLQVIVGTAPVNLAADPYACTNEPLKLENMEQAKKYCGYSPNFAKYTVCASISANFEIFAVSPIVVINVLDPTKHKKENAEVTFPVSNKQANVNVEGILLDTLVVKNDDTELVVNTDYVADFDDNGYVVISLIGDTVATELSVKSTSIAPELVTNADIIGGYNSETGHETGIQCVRKVYTKFNLIPAILLAPGWSHMKEIGAALDTKNKVNDAYSVENILDLDTTVAKKYTDVEQLKNDNGYTSKHSIVCWPKLSVDGVQYYFSALLGALMAYLDASNGNIPYLYPSNKLLEGVTAAVLEDGTEVSLDQPLANVLNAAGVVTVINDEGFRPWGNNMACYPDNTDPKDRWIAVRRTFSWWGNRFITAYKRNVDDPLNTRLIETIVDSENIYANSLAAQNYIAGGKMEYRPEENTMEDILNGHLKFRMYLAQYTPAEYIENTLEFDPNILMTALGGEE